MRACVPVVLAVCLACGKSGSGPSDAAAIASIVVTPPSSTVQSGKTQQLAAVAQDASGNALSGITFAWKTNASGVAAVGPAGLVTGAIAGTAGITASAQGVTSAPATVTVTAGAVASIAVSPPRATIAAGAEQSFTAVAKDEAGNEVGAATFNWQSDDTEVAAIDPSSGLAAGSKAGDAHITANAEGVSSASATLTVNAGPLASIIVKPPSMQMAVGDEDASLTATGSDAKGNLIAGLHFEWKTDDAGTATVQAGGDPSAAAVHAVAAKGEQTAAAHVTAAVGDLHGSATVTVKPRSISSVAVAPAGAAIHTGGTQKFTAVASQEGVPVGGVSFAWKSSNAEVATVDESGIVSGLSAGKATITASARGVTSKPGGDLTVAKDIAVSVTPSPQPLGITKTQEFKVSVSNVLKDGTVTWSVAEAGGGSIESTSASTALYTAPCRSGPFHVVATSNEDKRKSGSATVNITVPAPGTLDPCFSKGGMVVTSIGPSAAASAIVQQSDGKIVVVGKASDGAKIDFAVARYTPEGALDDSFGTKGVVLTVFDDPSEARAVALQDDGKIIVVGAAGAQFAIARYTAEGKADATFNSSGPIPGQLTLQFGRAIRRRSWASAVIVQRPSGRIVVGGSDAFTICIPRIGECETSAGFALVGLKPDGTIDEDFGGGPNVTPIGDGTFGELAALAVQSDGKLVGAGVATDPTTGNASFALARWTGTGALDAKFGPNGDGTAILVLGDDAAANAAVIQSDEKILLAGRAHPAGSMRGDSFALARFTANGTLDEKFGQKGSVLTSLLGADDSLYAMQLQNNGAIAVAGEARDADTKLLRFAVLRYTSAGALDETFAGKGAAIAPFDKADASARGMAFTRKPGLSDDILVTVAGSFGTRFALARYWP